MKGLQNKPTVASLQVTSLVCCHKMLICSLKVKAHYLGFARKQQEGVVVLLSLHSTYIWMCPAAVLGAGVVWGLLHLAQGGAVPRDLCILQQR